MITEPVALDTLKEGDKLLFDDEVQTVEDIVRDYPHIGDVRLFLSISGELICNRTTLIKKIKE